MSFRQLLLEMGADAAQAIAAGRNRQLVLELCAKTLRTMNLDEPVALFTPSMALAWAECGFPCLEPSHRLAASLMATTIPQECADTHLHMPWRCFGFEIPAGLLNTSSSQFVLVLHTHEGRISVLSMADRLLGLRLEERLSGLNAKLNGESCHDMSVTYGKRSTRESELMGRLFLGLCLEADVYRTSSSNSIKYKTKRGHKIPTAQVFKLTRNIVIDARSAVRNYVAGTGAGPMVQILVRGHWRLQAYGAGAVERKMIHVEPYWRGPEEAPIAVRSHILDVRPA